jgi:type IV secretory pathway TrbL component
MKTKIVIAILTIVFICSLTTLTLNIVLFTNWFCLIFNVFAQCILLFSLYGGIKDELKGMRNE